MLGLGIANDVDAPLGQNWWLVVVGVDAVVGAALVTRHGQGIVTRGIGNSADSRIALEPAGRQRELASFSNPVAPNVP